MVDYARFYVDPWQANQANAQNVTNALANASTRQQQGQQFAQSNALAERGMNLQERQYADQLAMREQAQQVSVEEKKRKLVENQLQFIADGLGNVTDQESLDAFKGTIQTLQKAGLFSPEMKDDLPAVYSKEAIDRAAKRVATFASDEGFTLRPGETRYKGATKIAEGSQKPTEPKVPVKEVEWDANTKRVFFNDGSYEDRPITLKDESKATPTDIDDFVADADAESLRKTGKPLTPGQKNEARLQFKRAQAEEAGMVRLAERNVDAITAEKIKYNEGIGKALAEIETAGRLAEAKGEETPEQKKQVAKTRMGGNLATLSNHFIKLNDMGAIINVDKPTAANVLAAISSSSLGQAFGNITGSNAQSIRQSINNIKPLLIQDIRQSTDMGARGLDSEKELEFYLQAATDEKSDIQSNIAAIVVLDDAFGNGQVAEQLRGLTDESLVKRISDQGNVILKGGTGVAAKPKTGTAPVDKATWLKKAKERNPNATDQALSDYYDKKYGQ